MESDTHCSNQRINKPRPNAGTDVSDWQDEAGGHAFFLRHVRERQVGFGHTDR